MEIGFKTNAEKVRFQLFLWSLIIVAFIINSVFFRPPAPVPVGVQYAQPADSTINQRQSAKMGSDSGSNTHQDQRQSKAAEQAAAERAQQESARKAAQAAEEHAKFIARHLNTGFVRKPGIRQIALVAASDDGKLNRELAGALAPHFQGQSVEILSTLFKEEFISDKLFAKVFEGSTDPLHQLDLANVLDSVVLAKESVRYSTDSSLLNLITAHLEVEVTLVPVSANSQSQAWKYLASGAGFKQVEALKIAEERLLRQISSATNLLESLSPQNQ